MRDSVIENEFNFVFLQILAESHYQRFEWFHETLEIIKRILFILKHLLRKAQNIGEYVLTKIDSIIESQSCQKYQRMTIWISEDETKIIWIGQDDQLRIISIIYGNDLGKAHQSLHKLLNGIEISSLVFAENNIYVVILLVQYIINNLFQENSQILQKEELMKNN
ncbi:unnamed protein product [Paramecium pentaurelia]|uniref:Phosphagen kinase C-terminal domain-containing protein n=1 Tax=Paramecium pentaurelia TaxID=43138 RepID=A0A8S1XI34_9CILI|nr:unnamed protein product [Paramecium pentaurelia]CAD8200811.1 unnamed protein product [Paramecium pentaurelia]